MIDISLTVAAMTGLNWARWQRLVASAEKLGFTGLYRGDHFILSSPPYADALELVVSLTYLADHTEHIKFGSLVAPLSFRDPVMLVRQAAAIDDLSGGRMVLGVGAGWMEEEHTMFGYDLGDIPTRLGRLEEGLAVITNLLRSNGPVTYEGHFFHLRDAVLLPRPQRPNGPEIMVGAMGPRLGLPIVAKYADIWNAQMAGPQKFLQRSKKLDSLLKNLGRKPNEVKRTITVQVVCGRDKDEFERRVKWARGMPGMADLSLDKLFETLQKWFPALIFGSPDEIVEQISAYKDVGVEELMIHWIDIDDIEGIQVLGEQVLPRFWD